MAKVILAKGDCVIAKKWDGTEIQGVYEYGYLDGSSCILDVNTNKRFNSKKGNVRIATQEEEKKIRQLIKTNKLEIKKQKTEENNNNYNEELEEALAAIE